MTTKKSNSRGRSRRPAAQWRRMDLHLHTPGSNDYQEPFISYLDILRQAELRGLDMIAFTDHNTIAGYTAMKKEFEQLEMLEFLGRLELDEKRRLTDYKRLRDKILVLPGFEFTATFGFHILGIFAPETPLAYLNHLLLSLNIPLEKLDQGSSTVGATSDVLTAYKVINEAGGIAIAAHANSGNGVMMRGMDLGGQTKISYTQDPNLHCLEVTDLDKRGRYSTRNFFNGSKPEYPRIMRCIQGSDAHRILQDPDNPKALGIGDRVTEIKLREVSFEALYEVLTDNDSSLTRPFRGKAEPFDFVQVAREEGASIVQSFHVNITERGGHFNKIVEDICGMSNTNGGTIYVGISADPKENAVGIKDVKKGTKAVETAVSERFTPEPAIEIDTIVSQKKDILRITVQPGQDVPYALDAHRIFVRDEDETHLAVRDEIVNMLERRKAENIPDPIIAPTIAQPTEASKKVKEKAKASKSKTKASKSRKKPTPKPSDINDEPKTGVEIVATESRNGKLFHTVRDLRKNNLVKDVTKESARKLWHYAISKAESSESMKGVKWVKDKAVLDVRKKDEFVWYDLALKVGDDIHIYYGVTDDGLNDSWSKLTAKANK